MNTLLMRQPQQEFLRHYRDILSFVEKERQAPYLNEIVWESWKATHDTLLPSLPRTFTAATNSSREEILLTFLGEAKNLRFNEIVLAYLIITYRVSVDQLHQNWLYWMRPVGTPVNRVDSSWKTVYNILSHFVRVDLLHRATTLEEKVKLNDTLSFLIELVNNLCEFDSDTSIQYLEDLRRNSDSTSLREAYLLLMDLMEEVDVACGEVNWEYL